MSLRADWSVIHRASRPAASRASRSRRKCLLALADRDEHIVAGTEIAADVQAPQRAPHRRTRPCDSPRRPASPARSPCALTMSLNEHPGIGQQQPGTPSGAAQPDAVGLDDERPQARGGARVGGGAAGQAAADDDDVGGVLAAKPWMIGTPFGGEGVDPGRDAVTCAHAMRIQQGRATASVCLLAFCITSR